MGNLTNVYATKKEQYLKILDSFSKGCSWSFIAMATTVIGLISGITFLLFKLPIKQIAFWEVAALLCISMLAILVGFATQISPFIKTMKMSDGVKFATFNADELKRRVKREFIGAAIAGGITFILLPIAAFALKDKARAILIGVSTITCIVYLIFEARINNNIHEATGRVRIRDVAEHVDREVINK